MRIPAIIFTMVLLVGCSGIKVKYDGDINAGTTQAVLLDALPEESAAWTFAGKAYASGAGNVSYTELTQALMNKAMEVGANAVFVTDYQVTPGASNKTLAYSSSQIWTEEGAAGGTWLPLERDFAGGYGKADLSALGIKGLQASGDLSPGVTGGAAPGASTYTRTIFADFYVR